MAERRALRSWLFVPALRGDLLAKAPRAGASVVLVDLEDSIPPARKHDARAALPAAIASLLAAGQRAAVRVNAGDPEDLEAACAAGAFAVVLPKVGGVADLPLPQQLADRGASAPLLFATIETARGWLAAAQISAAPGVAGVMFGAGDFALDTGMAYREDVLEAPAGAVVIAARAAGVPAFGLPGPLTDMADLAGLEAIAGRARALGFSGTPVIHPAQVPVIERVFRPTAEEIARARAVVARFESSDGLPSAHQGEIVEWPIYQSALALLRSEDSS